jgi:predicted RNA-binding protein YlqC (UPF0109 family)
VSRAREVVDVVARALADHPGDVSVVETAHGPVTLIELFVAPGDLGRVIGRNGRTAAALRMLVALVAEREGRRVQLELRDGPGAGA